MSMSELTRETMKSEGLKMEYIQELSEKTLAYNEYIREHISNVFKAWKAMQEKCKSEGFIYDDWYFWTIDGAIKQHDISKYSAQEFTQYRRNFYPCTGEEKDEEEFQAAWEHHYKNNNHHWQYWLNEDGTFKEDGGNTQLIAYIEMICDWTAMGYKFGDTALSYYENNKSDIKIAPGYVEFVERVLKQMSE